MIKKVLFVLILILIGFFLISRSINRSEYYVDSFNQLSFPERGEIKYESSLIEKNHNYSLEKIVYESKNIKIYSHLYIPLSEKPVPALIYLPAAGATKEALNNVASDIVSNGYAVLIIDMRGFGETTGINLPLEQEYELYKNGQTPQSFLFIYDALKAFDLLYNDKRIDKEKIIFTGESLGARTAITAAAMEKRSKGAIVFSTAGFNSRHPFVILVDPDNYISHISPRRIVMFHSLDDSVIPFSAANNTFAKAKQPKELIIMPAPCNHGWCFQIEDIFFKELGKF